MGQPLISARRVRRWCWVVGVLIWGEWANWSASCSLIPAAQRHPGLRVQGEVVIVLGFRSRGRTRANAVQRYRTRIAVRSTDARTGVGRLLFTGGAAHQGERSEAALMADYAVNELGVPASAVLLEERARSTWENIAYCLPLIEGATAIKIASNTFHARRARRYLWLQSPRLAARLHRAGGYRWRGVFCRPADQPAAVQMVVTPTKFSLTALR